VVCHDNAERNEAPPECLGPRAVPPRAPRSSGWWQRRPRTPERPAHPRRADSGLVLHHGVSELWSADPDFSAFSQRKVRNPLVKHYVTRRARPRDERNCHRRLRLARPVIPSSGHSNTFSNTLPSRYMGSIIALQTTLWLGFQGHTLSHTAFFRM